MADNPRKQSEPEEVEAYKAKDPEKLTVIVLAGDFRLPVVLAHIEAGKIVRVIPGEQRPPPET